MKPFYFLFFIIISVPMITASLAGQNEEKLHAERSAIAELKNLTLEELIEVSMEYKIKLAYLYRFINLVKWPESQQIIESKNIKMCVLGEDPFGSAVDKVLNRKINGRKLIVDYFPTISKHIKSCHLLYISSSEKERIPSILEYIKKSKVLTVAEAESFASNGGMLGFVYKDGGIGIELNLNATRSSGLKIDRKLQRFADIVKY